MYGEIIVYNIIAIIFTVQGINMRGFTKVSGVSETTHIGAVIQEIPNLRSQLDCARRCEPVSCISFSWNQQSKVCRAYNEELCDRGEPFLSPYLNYFVRDVREHIGGKLLCFLSLNPVIGSYFRVDFALPYYHVYIHTKYQG